MSIPIRPEQAWRPSYRHRVLARVAVALSWALTRFSPKAIRRVLSLPFLGRSEPGAREVLEWRNAVNHVSHHCAGNGCLQRSVAVMFLGFMHGRAPVWCTGFRLEPFSAHAWVEVGDQPVGEPGVVSQYKKVMSVSPPWARA